MEDNCRRRGFYQDLLGANSGSGRYRNDGAKIRRSCDVEQKPVGFMYGSKVKDVGGGGTVVRSEFQFQDFFFISKNSLAC